ncbi:SGNH/GDSL hydrolase family protein [Paenibacillus sp. MBLB4367]|uniref:SGNH/GDSL hydrolase family protein n=1 Tax=Paenibacillus sp. MBLB4367 TaxID=3384767 RepID=UPI0039082C33
MTEHGSRKGIRSTFALVLVFAAFAILYGRNAGKEAASDDKPSVEKGKQSVIPNPTEKQTTPQDTRKKVDPPNDAIEVQLPPTINALTGKEINIYFDNLIIGDAGDYLFDVVCSIGILQNERWTLNTNTAGTYPITINVYDKKSIQKVGTASATVIVKSGSVGSGVTKKALFIGDSTTAAGKYTGELLNLFSSDPMDIELLGSQGTAPNLHEGRGGWRVDQYFTNASSPFVFNGAFNFSQYMHSQGYTRVDYVFFHLGINDIFNETSDSGAHAVANAAVTAYNNMIATMKTLFPNIRIGMCLTIPPSKHQDAFGNNYGSGQTRWQYKRNWFQWNKAILAAFQNRTAENIYLVPLHAILDTEHNMSVSTVAVNARNSTTTVRQTDAVHPADTGYNQMADAIYCWLKGFES